MKRGSSTKNPNTKKHAEQMYHGCAWTWSPGTPDVAAHCSWLPWNARQDGKNQRIHFNSGCVCGALHALCVTIKCSSGSIRNQQ